MSTGKKMAQKTTNNHLIVRHSDNSYSKICDFLIDDLGFQDLSTVENSNSIKSKKSLAIDLVSDTINILRNLAKYRSVDTIVAIGYVAIPLKILAKLRLIRYKRLYWLAFFIHSPKWLAWFRLFVKFDTNKDYYILFSEFEQHFYHKELSIKLENTAYLPYGDWDNKISEQKLNTTSKSTSKNKTEIYYFAGGYSNRDYPPLIEVFNKLPYKLIIACSTLNQDIDNVKVEKNIQILKDISSDHFDDLVLHAKACILPLKHDTGASGQSVLLRYMIHRKIIISSRTNAVEEYIEHKKSGILLGNMGRELSEVIQQIETRPVDFFNFGDAVFEKFRLKFSFDVITKKLSEILSIQTNG
ncbi:MAG: glycosyltransferase [Gammaproteobacteria bacterium]|nr:glycosyltransferase [Gammaproteobacteria bacterium]